LHIHPWALLGAKIKIKPTGRFVFTPKGKGCQVTTGLNKKKWMERDFRPFLNKYLNE
jgi:hypothetical protein